MSRVIVTESHLSDIANAIRGKSGVQTTYTPGQMAAAVAALPDATTLVSKTVTENGVYHPADDGADGYDAVTVSVGGVSVIPEADWDAMPTAQKQAYGLTVIQTASSGYQRGIYVNGGDYFAGIVQTGSGVSEATFTASGDGVQLLVIALNAEASTYDLTVSASRNGTAMTGETLGYHAYAASGDDRRNYRVNVYGAHIASGDEIHITLADRGRYGTFAYAVLECTLSELLCAHTTCDAAASGAYESSAVAVCGTFKNTNAGTPVGSIASVAPCSARETVTTEYPGNRYSSGFIFWCSQGGAA